MPSTLRALPWCRDLPHCFTRRITYGLRRGHRAQAHIAARQSLADLRMRSKPVP